jgi:hypothetical protein
VTGLDGGGGSRDNAPSATDQIGKPAISRELADPLIAGLSPSQNRFPTPGNPSNWLWPVVPRQLQDRAITTRFSESPTVAIGCQWRPDGTIAARLSCNISAMLDIVVHSCTSGVHPGNIRVERLKIQPAESFYRMSEAHMDVQGRCLGARLAWLIVLDPKSQRRDGEHPIRGGTRRSSEWQLGESPGLDEDTVLAVKRCIRHPCKSI